MATITETRPTAALPPLSTEEVLNSITHGLGCLAAVAGIVWLMPIAQQGNALHIIGCGVYGATLIMLYAASTLYHYTQGRAKDIFRQVDHICIYLLIAGTYTPFTMLKGDIWGWSILTSVWTLSSLGIALMLLRNHRLDSVYYLPYIAIGWLALVAARPMFESFPIDVVAWIFIGGGFYTGGVYFVMKDDRPYYHVIWHLFVLAGSLSHYIAVMHVVRFVPA